MTFELQTWAHLERRVQIFRDVQTALEHIRDHILTGPECHAWSLILGYLTNDPDILEDTIGSLDAYQRQQCSRRIFASPLEASNIYERYTEGIKRALNDAVRLRWSQSTGSEHIAFSPLGILVIWNESFRRTGTISTAFLPGLGVPFDTSRSRNSGPMLLRESLPIIKPMRDGRLGKSARHVRIQEICSNSEDILTKIYYKIFKEALRAVRDRAARNSNLLKDHPFANIELDTGLFQALPKRGMISLAEWKEYFV